MSNLRSAHNLGTAGEASLSPVPKINWISIHILPLNATLLLLGIFAFRHATFFTSDSGLPFVQVTDLVANGWDCFAVEYGGQPFDPRLKHAPFYFAYPVVDGEIFLSISPFYPLLSSFFLALLGRVGLAIVLVLASALTAVAIYKLGRLSGLVHSRLLLWVSVFATPLLVYSLELWDHSLAAAFATWAVYRPGSERDRDGLQFVHRAGGGVALGLVQRPEMYAFSLALGGGILIAGWPVWQRFVAYGVGGVIGAVPVSVLQYPWVTYPVGMPTFVLPDLAVDAPSHLNA